VQMTDLTLWGGCLHFRKRMMLGHLGGAVG